MPKIEKRKERNSESRLRSVWIIKRTTILKRKEHQQWSYSVAKDMVDTQAQTLEL